MKDPIKKFEELKSLTEGIFEGLFDRVKTPPSVQQSDALKSYREKFQIRYKIVGNPARKEYNAMDLIKAYENGEIDKNTELVQVGVKNPKPARFEEFMKYEPYKSGLKKQTQNEEPEFTDIVRIGYLDFPGNPAKKGTTEDMSIKDLSDLIRRNPNMENLIQVVENKKWIPLKKSSIYETIQSINPPAPAPAPAPAPVPAPTPTRQIYHFYFDTHPDSTKENVIFKGSVKDIFNAIKDDPSLENFLIIISKNKKGEEIEIPLKQTGLYNRINALKATKKP